MNFVNTCYNIELFCEVYWTIIRKSCFCLKIKKSWKDIKTKNIPDLLTRTFDLPPVPPPNSRPVLIFSYSIIIINIIYIYIYFFFINKIYKKSINIIRETSTKTKKNLEIYPTKKSLTVLPQPGDSPAPRPTARGPQGGPIH